MPEYRLTELEDRLIYRMLRVFIRIVGLIPRRWMGVPGRVLGLLWHTFDKRHRDLARDNVSRAFGWPKDSARTRDLVRRSFQHFATVALEMPSLFTLDRRDIRKDIIFHDFDKFAVSGSTGTPMLIVTPHMGNWELLSLFLTIELNFKINIVVRTMDLPPLDHIITEMRERAGSMMLPKQNVAERMGELLQANRLVGILIDQNASWYDGIYVPFFGRIACTTKGAASLALNTGVPVFPVFSRRLPDGRYELWADEPVSISRSGDFRRDLVENTVRYNKAIEKGIRRAPEQWLWIHRRWNLKNVPEEGLAKLAPYPGQTEIIRAIREGREPGAGGAA